MTDIIELDNVSFHPQNRNVVQELSIEFGKSKTTAIVGPSGGGKSTVMKLAAGLLVPNHGEVYYMGKNVAHMNRIENLEFRKEGAFVFQDSALWANQSLYQILELPLRIHFPHMNKKERDERIKEVTAEVNYRKDLHIRPSLLSMGEQKLIAFARAMLCGPSLLFLDEWTAAVDETSSVRLINIVKRKQKEGVSILFISHDMRLIKDLADDIVVIADGKLSFKETKENVISDPELSNRLRMGMEL